MVLANSLLGGVDLISLVVYMRVPGIHYGHVACVQLMLAAKDIVTELHEEINKVYRNKACYVPSPKDIITTHA